MDGPRLLGGVSGHFGKVLSIVLLFYGTARSRYVGGIPIEQRRKEQEYMNEVVQKRELDQITELTANIVAAYVGKHVVSITQLPSLIADTYAALAKTAAPQVASQNPEKPSPAVPVKKSIEREWITCLEDGLKFKSLRRHLMVAYNMTPDQYREKWGLPADYPMTAPAYAERRSALAKNAGFGTKAKRRKPEAQ